MRRKPQEISVTAYEIDSSLIESLRATLSGCQRDCERAGISFSATVFNTDFIEAAVPMARRDLFAPRLPLFNAAIINPPYRKIRSDSTARLLLRSAGIETSNLYTGFLALIIKLLHLVMDDDQAATRLAMSRLTTTLAGLGLSVSTGRVVDFRARTFLRQQPGDDTVPLIYPCHLNGGLVNWPKENSRKPNAIANSERTKDLLVPTGIYVLVKRFTAKEERRRIVACIYDPEQIQSPLVGFENHLNYFHVQGGGLPIDLAKGLTAFLNSTLVDVYFRQFNGHTQVNATDLRSLNYPTKEQLQRLGWKAENLTLKQSELDALVEKELDVRS